VAAAGVFVLLQRRRYTVSAALLIVVALTLVVAPIPQSYLDRLNTIRTYEEIGEDSALSRPHFWQVGLQMALARPLGVGLRQYESAYDDFDFLYGRFGKGRAVHSAHVQVLAELGFVGAAIWAGLFAYAAYACVRIRAQSFDERLSAAERQFLFTTANGLLVSMFSFVVGGAFLSAALNDITWLTFALVAALHRVARPQEELVARPVGAAATQAPLAFRVVGSFASRQSRQR
jgi:O-antigen ligase